jgi:hypothetical protein
MAGAQHHTPTRHPAHHPLRGTTHHASHHPPDALSTAGFLSSTRRLAKRSRVRRRVSTVLQQHSQLEGLGGATPPGQRFLLRARPRAGKCLRRGVGYDGTQNRTVQAMRAANLCQKQVTLDIRTSIRQTRHKTGGPQQCVIHTCTGQQGVVVHLLFVGSR